MPEPTKLEDVPPDRVGPTVQLLVTLASIVTCTKQSDGNWTIQAS
jgi:hypothetical protein